MRVSGTHERPRLNKSHTPRRETRDADDALADVNRHVESVPVVEADALDGLFLEVVTAPVGEPRAQELLRAHGRERVGLGRGGGPGTPSRGSP